MDAQNNPRYHMWCRLIDGYGYKSKVARTEAKRKIAEQRGLDTFYQLEPTKEDYMKAGIYSIPISNTSTTAISTPQHSDDTYTTLLGNIASSAIKENKKMCYDCMGDNLTPDEKKTDYLLGRLESLLFNKEAELEKQFGLANDTAPSTFNELIERITSGKYEIKEDLKDAFSYQGLSYVTWRDPAVKADHAGFRKAREALNAAYRIACDDIKIQSPEDGLKTLRAFGAWTFTA